MAKTKEVQLDIAESVEEIFHELEKELGDNKGALLVNDWAQDNPITGWVQSPSFLLDCATGFSKGFGLAMPNIVELSGPDNSAKSALLLSYMASIQRMGGVVWYIDPENSLKPNTVKLSGINVMDKSRFKTLQFESIEECLKAVEIIIERHVEKMPSVPLGIGLDSVAAALSFAEAKEEAEDMDEDAKAVVAEQARILKRKMRRLIRKVRSHNILFVITNHLIYDIGQSKFKKFGPPSMQTPGGGAIRYFASVRMEMKFLRTIKRKETDVVYASRISVEVKKNRFTDCWRKVEIEVRSTGVEDYDTLVEFMLKHGGINQEGTRLVWRDRKMYQSVMRDFFLNNPEEWIEFKKDALDVMSKIWDEKKKEGV